jgi:dolichyl-phosphate-mannose--protein O-mannosyl transferase
MSAGEPKGEASREGGATFSYRIGAAIFSSLMGAVLGLCFGEIYFATKIFVLCGLIAGALAGAVFPEVSILIPIGIIRFFFGIFSVVHVALTDEFEEKSSGQSSSWLKAIFLFGISYAILVAICFCL